MKLFFNLIFEINLLHLATPLSVSKSINLNLSLLIVLLGLIEHILVLIPILISNILQKDHLKNANLAIARQDQMFSILQ